MSKYIRLVGVFISLILVGAFIGAPAQASYHHKATINLSTFFTYDRFPLAGDAHADFRTTVERQLDGQGWKVYSATLIADENCDNFDHDAPGSLVNVSMTIVNGNGNVMSERNANVTYPSCSHEYWGAGTIILFNTPTGKVCADFKARVDHSNDIIDHYCFSLNQFTKVG